MKNEEKIKLLAEIEKLRLRNTELEEALAHEKKIETPLQRKILSRALLNIPTDAVMLVDKNCTIIDVNETTARRYYTFVEQLIGTSLLNLFSESISTKIKSYINRVAETMQPLRFEDENLGIYSDVVFYPIFSLDLSVEQIAVVSRDITKLKEVEKQLSQSNKKNQALLKVIPDPVVRCSRNGVIQDIHSPKNDFPIDLNSELIGSPIFDFIPTKYVHSLIFNIEKSFHTKKVQILEFKNETLSKLKFIELRIVSEEPEGFTIIFRDITDWKNIENRLIQAKELAEKADELKSNFLAQMSHEVRTPLNSIVNFTSILRSELYENASVDLKACFNSINKGVRRLIRTMDLLLNMAQIQTGDYEIITKHINLNKILSGAVKEQMNLANEKKLKMEYLCELEQAYINADEYSVHQIFFHLIDNAINYTNSGDINIRLFENNGKICVEIKDTGIGISKEYLPSIFDPFSQEESGYTRKFDGNGLGLALIKHFCDYNNAEIKAASRKGHGSKFTVSFVKRD